MTCSRPQRNVHRPGFEPGTPWSEIRHPNHCATPPLYQPQKLAKAIYIYMSRVVRKPAFGICENKDADQLRQSCVVVQPGLCGTLSETPKTGFLTTRLIFFVSLTHNHCELCMYIQRSEQQRNWDQIARTAFLFKYGKT